MSLIRSRSQHRKKWGAELKQGPELDALDRGIIQCLNEKPGRNITQVWMCLNAAKGKMMKRQVIYYRINTLEQAGFIITKRGSRNERKCYLTIIETEKELK